MSLFILEKKNGKNFLNIEISKGTVSKLNSLKKFGNDPKKFVNEAKKILNVELDGKLTSLL